MVVSIVSIGAFDETFSAVTEETVASSEIVADVIPSVDTEK